MAQLLRIEPQIPDLSPGQIRVPPPAGAYIGRALQDFGETIEKVEGGAASAEAARSVAEGAAEFDGIIQEHARTVVDPNEFLEKGSAAIEEARRRRLDNATSPRSRTLIERSLSDNALKANNKLKVVRAAKLEDKAKGDYLLTRDLLKNSAMEATEENRPGVFRMYGRLIGGLTNSGLMSQEGAAKEFIKFKDDVAGETMNRDAARNPQKFRDAYDAGDYKGVNSELVDRALKIAGATETARAVRDQKAGKGISDAAERAFEAQAGSGTLDVRMLQDAQVWYGWDKSEVDKIVKMQLGLTVRNPYESLVIEDAMASVDRDVEVSPAQVREAEAALQAKAAEGLISNKSPEYRAAMRRLQGLARDFRISGEVRERYTISDNAQSRTKARTRVVDLYNEFRQDIKPEERREELGRHNRLLDDMNDQQRNQYTNDLKGKFEKEQKAGPTPLQKFRGLRLPTETKTGQ